MGLIREASKEPHLLHGPAGNNHFRRPQQTVLQSVTAPGLPHNNSFGKLLAWLMSDCFMQVWVERFPLGLDGLQSTLSQQIIELLLDKNHSGINGRVCALLSCCCETKLKIVNNCH